MEEPKLDSSVHFTKEIQVQVLDDEQCLFQAVYNDLQDDEKFKIWHCEQKKWKGGPTGECIFCVFQIRHNLVGIMKLLKYLKIKSQTMIQANHYFVLDINFR